MKNDRSVRVISSDAENVRQVSYSSKRKYKLDLSSLHEDHEDDENAEIEDCKQSLKWWINFKDRIQTWYSSTIYDLVNL